MQPCVLAPANVLILFGPTCLKNAIAPGDATEQSHLYAFLKAMRLFYSLPYPNDPECEHKAAAMTAAAPSPAFFW
jgi:hypothetical protein